MVRLQTTLCEMLLHHFCLIVFLEKYLIITFPEMVCVSITQCKLKSGKQTKRTRLQSRNLTDTVNINLFITLVP